MNIYNVEEELTSARNSNDVQIPTMSEVKKAINQLEFLKVAEISNAALENLWYICSC